ncbi:MAG: ferrous iron transporter B [Candidatus Altiarchaeota archaeon]|nr:ferrous iron transporter B [Candidatus Altiarchaeota archaeon]
MKILLVGNPNVGKSVVFSRLTGVDVVVSNYPGTTVEYTNGSMRIGEETSELIDTPGTYSLEPRSKVEEVTAQMIKEADVVINVVDSTNLERNLYLTLELLELDIPLIVALNMWDEAKHLGIEIDREKLEEILRIPVIPTVAVTGEGIKELVSRISEAKSPDVKKHTRDDRWVDIGKIVKEVQVVRHRHHTIGERIADATIRPLTGVPFALAVLAVTFMMVALVGEGLKSILFDPIFELYKPLVMQLSLLLGYGTPLHYILVGELSGGGIDFMESLGLLTTGLYVPFAVILPYIVAFYFMLSVLEDSGYLPRLATLMDNIFHRLGMHGHGIVPVFLGLGCNVPGIIATRTLETRKQRFIAATLMAIAVPCMGQTAMIFAILGDRVEYLYLIFITLILVYVIGGLIMNRFVQGECPEIFLEVPPYRRPSLKTLLKKTLLRVKWFLADAIPWLFFGIFLVNMLYTLGFLDLIGGIFAPLVESWFGLPREVVVVLLAGFLRKDLAVGMLLSPRISGMMTPEQFVVTAVVLTMYFPCAASFATLFKELGLRDTIESALIMVSTAFLVGGILRIILLGF